MKTLRLHGTGDLRLHEEPDPVPRADELLVRVTGVGLCGSDRHWFLEGGIGDALVDVPLVLGHEFAGVVATGPRAGERVVLDPAVPCRRCDVCRSGLPHLCPEVRFAGHGTTDGALRTLAAWPAELAQLLPDSIPDVEAPLLEPLGVALHAVRLGHAGPGTTAAVVGCGPIGLLIVSALQAAGAAVVFASDPLPHRAQAAAERGAVLEAAGGAGVDVAFEAAGEDAAVDDAIAAARPGGRVVLVGIPDRDHTTFTASVARRKGLTLSLCRRMKPEDLPHAVALAADGRVELASLVTGRYGLDDAAEAFAALVDRRGLKVVVEP